MRKKQDCPEYTLNQKYNHLNPLFHVILLFFFFPLKLLQLQTFLDASHTDHKRSKTGQCHSNVSQMNLLKGLLGIECPCHIGSSHIYPQTDQCHTQTLRNSVCSHLDVQPPRHDNRSLCRQSCRRSSRSHRSLDHLRTNAGLAAQRLPCLSDWGWGRVTCLEGNEQRLVRMRSKDEAAVWRSTSQTGGAQGAVHKSNTRGRKMQYYCCMGWAFVSASTCWDSGETFLHGCNSKIRMWHHRLTK